MTSTSTSSPPLVTPTSTSTSTATSTPPSPPLLSTPPLPFPPWQGPEHSSARLERFLQMCDDDEDVFPDHYGRQTRLQEANWQIVNVTTPANYFHVLRRQVPPPREEPSCGWDGW